MKRRDGDISLQSVPTGVTPFAAGSLEQAIAPWLDMDFKTCLLGARRQAKAGYVVGGRFAMLRARACSEKDESDVCDDEERGKKKLVMTHSTRVNTLNINTIFMSNQHTWYSDHCETLALSEQE